MRLPILIGAAVVMAAALEIVIVPAVYCQTVDRSQSSKPLGRVAMIEKATAGRQHYVSPSGSASGDGTIDHPWDLQTGLSQSPAIQPGDQIWIRGGTYGQGREIFRSNLMGTPAAPIVVRQYPGERAIINGWLQVGCCDRDPQPNGGAYVWFWGLEFASSIMDRTGYPAGPPKYGESAVLDSVDSWAPGSKFINNVIHDTRMGISMWAEATDAEAYGNIIYNNGFQASDRGHGHGFYVQNNIGTKYITDNIVFNQFDNGIQAYGSDQAQVRNITVEGNIVFNNGAISGSPADNVVFAGGGGVSGARVINNYFFHAPLTNLGYNELGWGGVNTDLTVQGNYFMGGFQSVAMGNWQSVKFQNNHIYSHAKYDMVLSTSSSTAGYAWDGNTYYGSGMFLVNDSGTSFEGWKSKTHVDASSTFRSGDPTGTWIFVRPNKYEQGRANIAIYNWSLADSVAVDLRGVLRPGRRYEIRDAQNFLAGPCATGTFDGSPVRISMAGLSVAMPNGFVPVPPNHTAPQFGTFVVIALP